MRKIENLDVYHTLEQLLAEVYQAARQMDPEHRNLEGVLMREASTKALSKLVHGCSTRNDATFVPYIEASHGYSEELRQHLRTCRRFRMLPESEVAFLLQRQQSLSSQLVRLLRRTMFNAEQQRHGKGTIDPEPMPGDEDYREPKRQTQRARAKPGAKRKPAPALKHA